jgi:hypothetical protein
VDLSVLQDIIKAAGLDVALYGTAGVLALALRFARAYWRWADDPHTLALAVGLGLVGAALVLTVEHRAWQIVVMQGISLSVVVLVGERVLRSQAGKFGLPADNEWTDDLNQGGTK